MTGYFKDFTFIMIIIILHECGHILPALLFSWNIEKIKILPFGGLTIFHEDINKPLIEELWILICGPLSQMILCTICSFYITDPIFLQYHIYILIFNLLPIVPLDGSKLINIISNYFFPYLKSYRCTYLISILGIITFIILLFNIPFNLMYYFMILFLGIEVAKTIINEKMYFNRFLLERYEKNFYFYKRRRIIGEDTTKMKRDVRHLFFVKNKWQTEKEMLRKRFDLS